MTRTVEVMVEGARLTFLRALKLLNRALYLSAGARRPAWMVFGVLGVFRAVVVVWVGLLSGVPGARVRPRSRAVSQC